MAKAFGIDVSRWQGQINFDTLAGRGDVFFIGIRNGISWGYDDPWFPRNWAEAKRVGILRAAYHVLYPGEDATRQMNRMFRTLDGDFGELPLVIDAELVHGQSRAKITASILECAQIIHARTNELPILYSRANWLNDYTFPEQLTALDLWLAQYLFIKPGETYAREHPGPPTLPRGFETWLFHQTGDKCDPRGFGIPAPPDAAETLDYNRFNGTVEDLLSFANVAPLAPDPDPIPAPEPLGQRMAALERRVARLERLWRPAPVVPGPGERVPD